MKNWYYMLIAGLLLAFMPSNLQAQKGKLKKAKKLYEAFSFPEAAELYKQVAEKKGTPEAIINLAECYRLMNMPSEAENWYAKVIELPEAEDIHYLRYGMALKINDKCDEARDVFLEYANRVPADTRGVRQAEACSKEKYFKQDPGIYILHLADVNSAASDFGPAFFEDGILFSSARGMKFEERVYNWTNAPYLDLYTAEKEKADGNPWELKKPKLFKGKTNSWLHEGTVTFSNDEQTMFFTRNNYIKGKKGKDNENTIRLKIYSVKRNGDKWGDIKELPFNSDEYSVGHPTLTTDNQTLYFVSDMPGGYGNEDIYMSQAQGEDGWSEPVNLGPTINTEGREMFPFIHEDGTLYFSSDALPGLGGLDVFEAKNINGDWTDPENLRVPINSYFDDFGFIINKEKIEGYLASNRYGGKGDDDIYSFTRTSLSLEGLVVDCNTKKPLDDVKIQLFENDEMTQEIISYADGKFSFPIITDVDYKIKASRINYEETELDITAEELSGSELELTLQLCPEDTTAGIGDPDNNGNGDGSGGDGSGTNGSDNLSIKCQLKGKVYDRETGDPVANATVRLTNAITKFSTTATTDENGYYFIDVDREMDYLVMASKSQYFTETEKFSTKGRDCSSPLSQDIPIDLYMSKINVNPLNPGLIPEAVLSLNHIYYDLDKDFIRSDAAIELDKVVKLLYENPGIILELGSHTDARASDAYNMKLSQRRAQSAVDYIVGKGIASDRITAVGYGETQLLNECANGVQCTDTKHQENRRTEFKVVGYRDNAVYSLPRYFGADSYYNSNDYTEYTTPTYNSTTTYTSSTTTTTNSYDSGEGTFFDSSSSSDASTSFTDNTATSSESFISFGTGTEYKIQLGSFKNMPSLSAYENALSDLGYSIGVDSSSGVNRIVVGPFYDKVTAEEILKRVRNQYGDAFIVRYENGQRQ